VDLDLVYGRRDLGVGEKRGDLWNSEVGETDGFREASFVEFLECSPGRLWVFGKVFLDDVLYGISAGSTTLLEDKLTFPSDPILTV